MFSNKAFSIKIFIQSSKSIISILEYFCNDSFIYGKWVQAKIIKSTFICKAKFNKIRSPLFSTISSLFQSFSILITRFRYQILIIFTLLIFFLIIFSGMIIPLEFAQSKRILA